MGMNYSNIFKGFLLLNLLIFVSGCKDDPKRHLELGEWYANKGLVEEAILEFKEVTRLYPASLNNLKREDFQSLSKAHYNLSLMYTKKGWWDYALEEAELCFKLQPTKKHFDLLDLIKQRSELENSES
jgi:tetratricopeptide (TPR) repeat protein|tara:strand:- start:650 stop:1033 length:384 start_codon:yes stop_codon:yes gene_type:complete